MILPFELYVPRTSSYLPGPSPGYLRFGALDMGAYFLSFQGIAWMWLVVQGFLLVAGVARLSRNWASWMPYLLVSALLVWEASYPRIMQTTLNAILE